MRRVISVLVILSMGALLCIAGCRNAAPDSAAAPSPAPAQAEAAPAPESTPIPEPAKGAYETGTYRKVFAECGYEEADIQAKIDEAWEALFYGGDDTRIYFESGGDEAYIMDIGNNDVRSEGMSYGMMMCVQLDKKAEFDRLWKWAKTHMQQTEGPNAGYFAWSMNPDGTPNDTGPAPDGEEYFAMSLFFASHRWGDADAPYDYSEQARAISTRPCTSPMSRGRAGACGIWTKSSSALSPAPTSPTRPTTCPISTSSFPSGPIPGTAVSGKKPPQPAVNFSISPATPRPALPPITRDSADGPSPPTAMTNSRRTRSVWRAISASITRGSPPTHGR